MNVSSIFAAASLIVMLGAMASRADHARNEPLAPIPATTSGDQRKAALGERLFYDRQMSRSGRLSCASCHDLATNGASPRRNDVGDNGQRLFFNTPTIFNASLNYRYNWEGNVRTIPQLVQNTLRNGHLMGAGAALTIERLRRDLTIDRAFRSIYGRPADEQALDDALDSFVRTLLTPNSRFDRWLGGDDRAMDATELRGYARFKAVGCAACHQGVGIGGNLYQRHGIFEPLASPFPVVLRVPSLRNVAVTAPYFHDGSTPDLRQAVRAMARAQLGMNLNDGDVADITAFLHTLTGTYRGHALTGPSGPP